MVSENLLRLHGTSSKEIESKAIARTKAIYEPQIQKLTEEISTLKELLLQNGIAFN